MNFIEACSASLEGKGPLINKFGDKLYGSHITGKIQCKPASGSDIVYISTDWSFESEVNSCSLED